MGWMPHTEGLCQDRSAPPHLPPFCRTPRKNLLSSKTSVTEADAVPARHRTREEAFLAFVFTRGEISLDTAFHWQVLSFPGPTV